MNSCWQNFADYPPYYVRLWAKNGPTTALSDAEIAIASGIDINRVREIKFMTDWNRVMVGEALRYCTACNFDPMNSADRIRARDYDYRCRQRNNVPFNYLKRSPKWASEILPVLLILKQKLISGSSAV